MSNLKLCTVDFSVSYFSFEESSVSLVINNNGTWYVHDRK